MGWSIALVMMLGGWLFNTIISGTREDRAGQNKKDATQNLAIETNRLRIEASKEHKKKEIESLKVKDKEQDGRLQAVERNLDRVIDSTIK